jgi:hypothetical protein
MTTSSGRIFAIESVFSPKNWNKPAELDGIGASLSRLFFLLKINHHSKDIKKLTN